MTITIEDKVFVEFDNDDYEIVLQLMRGAINENKSSL